MSKKAYIVPEMNEFKVMAEPLMAGSMNPNDDHIIETPSDDEYDGEFGSRMGNVWDDED